MKFNFQNTVNLSGNWKQNPGEDYLRGPFRYTSKLAYSQKEIFRSLSCPEKWYTGSQLSKNNKAIGHHNHAIGSLACPMDWFESSRAFHDIRVANPSAFNLHKLKTCTIQTEKWLKALDVKCGEVNTARFWLQRWSHFSIGHVWTLPCHFIPVWLAFFTCCRK